MRKYEFFATVNNGTNGAWVQWCPIGSAIANAYAKEALETIKAATNPLVLSEATWPHTLELASNGNEWSWTLFQQDRVVSMGECNVS